MSAALLSLRDLRKRRADSERVFDVALPALDLAPGGRIALSGESGSGKSTLLSLLALATGPDGAGAFHFAGQDVAAAWRRGDQRGLSRLRAGAIAYLPQRDGLLDFLTVRQNIACAAKLGGAAPVRDLAEIAGALQLGELLDARPAGLSGGQRQRAAVACALARRPRLILADEPTASLDADNAARVVGSLCELGAKLGAALIFATHQLGQLAGLGFTTFVAIREGEARHRRSHFEPA